MQNQKTQTNGEYRNVALEVLEESTTNPRKRFNEENLKELAASFKSPEQQNHSGSICSGRYPSQTQGTE